MVALTRPPSPLRRVRVRLETAPLATRLLVILLVGGSAADLATTQLALAWGASERSPGGSLVLASLGVAGLLWLKVAALLFVWLLNREWRHVGRAVAWGLALLTGAAVSSNFAVLAAATAVL